MFTKTENVEKTMNSTPKVKKDHTVEKQIVKAIAIRVGVVVVVHFASEALIKAIDNKVKNKNQTTEK